MRLISLVVVLLIVAFIVSKQLGGTSSTENTVVSDTTQGQIKVPTKPEDIQKFEKDLNALVKTQAEERARLIEEAEK